MGQSLFVMVDGLDGSGKGVALEGLKEWAQQKGLRVLDMNEYWKENSSYPSEEQLKECDVVLTFEPTGSAFGKRIRDEIIAKNSEATPSEVAEAFSKDRKDHYERLIVPALKNNLHIFQDRGVISSIAYQSLMDEKLTVDYLVNLEGNWIALENSPDLIVVTDVSPNVAEERLGKRKKQDNAIFEKLEFQRKLAKIYKSDDIKDLFEGRETQLVFLDTNPPKTPEDTKKGIIQIVEQRLQ